MASFAELGGEGGFLGLLFGFLVIGGLVFYVARRITRSANRAARMAADAASGLDPSDDDEARFQSFDQRVAERLAELQGEGGQRIVRAAASLPAAPVPAIRSFGRKRR